MPRYSGALGKPLEPIPGFGVKQSEERDKRLQKQLATIFCKNFLLLFRHFDISPESPDAWIRLSFALAREHVPAFSERTRPGAKRKWSLLYLSQLKGEVECLISQKGERPGFGVSWACSRLIKQEPWKSFVIGSTHPENILKRQYHYACLSDELIRLMNANAPRVKE